MNYLPEFGVSVSGMQVVLPVVDRPVNPPMAQAAAHPAIAHAAAIWAEAAITPKRGRHTAATATSVNRGRS